MKKPKERLYVYIFGERFRQLFWVSNIVVPIVIWLLVFAHLYWYVTLSWELLALVATGLLPFLLPLLYVYISEIGVIKLRPDVFKDYDQVEAVKHTLVEALPSPNVQIAQQTGTGPLPVDPHFLALAKEEQKMFRTLWKNQSDYIRKGQTEVWGFKVREASPDYPQFVRGFGSLFQRGYVKQDQRGLVFLTDSGIGYCQRNNDLLTDNGDSWTQFSPS